MPTYFGNVGHLMQHWTLCKLVNIADKHSVPGLNYIDAHAMAPVALRRVRNDTDFNMVRDNLPGQGSSYELAWDALLPGDARNKGYPNSANFVQHIWKHDLSMLLCDTDFPTVTVLNDWLPSVKNKPNCKKAEVYPGDWLYRFSKGFPTPTQVGLTDGSLTLVSLDPYKYNRNRNESKFVDGDLYPADLESTMDALESVEGGVIIQLSTYSTSGGNRQDAVISSVHQILAEARFTRAATVRVNDVRGDQQMMSLVYARDIWWWPELARLRGGFIEWFDGLNQ